MNRKRLKQRHFDKIYTYENAHNKPYQYVVDDFIKNQFSEEQYNAYNVSGENSPSWISKEIDKFVYGFTHIRSSWNLMQEKRLQSNIKDAELELQRVNQNINELFDIEQYLQDADSAQDIYEKILDLGKNIRKAQINGDTNSEEYIDTVNQYNKLKSDYDKLDKQLAQKTQFYRTEGKNSPNILQLLYDPDKDSMSAEEITKNVVYSQKGGWYFGNGLQNDADKVVNNILNIPEAIIEAGASALGKIFPSKQQIRDFYGEKNSLAEAFSGYDRGEFTRRYIAKTDPYDLSTDKWFVDVRGDRPTRNKIKEQLKEQESYYSRLKNERQQEVVDADRKLRTGTWYFNPNGIDPKFRNIQESNRYGAFSFLNPANLPYSFSELGSSLSMYESMLGNIAWDTAIAYLTKKISTRLIMAPLAALQFTKDAASTMSAIQKLQRAQDISKNLDLLGKAVAFSGSVYFTRQMRRNETNNEAAEAWINRIMSESMNRNINMYQVQEAIKKQLPIYGIDPTGLKDNEIVERGVAFNINTGNPDFEDIKSQTRKGLAELINKNNALAFIDYIETLPFLSYQGSIFKTVAQRKNILPKYDKAGRITNWRQLEDAQIYNNIVQRNPEILKAMDPSIRAFIDKKIDFAAKKIFSNPIRRKMFSDSAKFFNKKASLLFPLMTKEGIEEGQQNLIQKAYEAGLYDNYNQEETMFDMPSFMDDTMLAADAVSAYIGGMFGDPDTDTKELMQAMAIGAMTAMWFRAPHAISTNLLSQKQKQKLVNHGAYFLNPEADNFRGLLSQLKDDKILGKMISESAQAVQDDNHIGVFFDAAKRGRTFEQLNNTLEEYKQYKGPGVENQFIEDDQSLLATTYALYDNPVTTDKLEKLGITKNSEGHRFYIQDAVTVITKARRGQEKVKENDDQYEEQTGALFKHLDETIDKILGVNQSQEENLENPEQEDEFTKFIRELIEDRNVQLDAEAHRKANPPMEEIRKRALKNLGLQESNVKKPKGRTTLKQRRQLEDNKKNLDNEIQRILKEEYTVPEFEDRDADVRDFIHQKFKSMLDYQQLITYDFLRKFLKDRVKALQFIKKEFGIPVQPDVLEGMVRYLEEVYSKAHADQKKFELELQAYLKQVFEQHGIQATEEDYKEQLDILYDTKHIPQDLKSLIINKTINKALSAILQNSAQSYLYGQADPNYMRLFQRQLTWNQLSPEQRNVIVDDENKNREHYLTEDEVKYLYNKKISNYYKTINDLRKRYNAIKKEFDEIIVSDNSNSEQQNKKNEKLKELIDIEEQASDLYIRTRLQNKIDRSVSAHYDRTKNTESILSQFENTNYDDTALPYLNISSSSESKSDEQLDENKNIETAEQIPGKNEERNNGPQNLNQEGPVVENKNIETPEQQNKDKSDEHINYNKSQEQGFVISEQERRLIDEYLGEDPDEQLANRTRQQEEAERNDGPEIQDTNINDENQNENDNIEDTPQITDQDLKQTFGSNINDEIDQDEDRSIEDTLQNKSNENLEENYQQSNGKFKNRKPQSNVSSSEEAKIDYLSRTLFYQPFKLQNGERVPNEEIPNIQIGSLKVRLLDGATLKSPAELSRRLVQNGWFAKTKKYFIITADVEHVDMTNPDSLNVIMIIQDGKDAFAVFMRGLSQHWTNKEDINRISPKKDRLEELKMSLREMFVSDEYRFPNADINSQAYQDVLKKRTKIYYEQANVLYESETGDVYTGTDEEAWKQRVEKLKQWERKQSTDVIDTILNRQRSKMRKPGKPVMTEQRIREQIDALREARQAIIDKCVSKDVNGEYMLLADGYKIVMPSEQDVVMSNGQFNNQRDKYGKPVYRKCSDTDMGVSSDITELTQQIFKDEIKVGYGVGERVDDESLVGAILNIDPTKVGNSEWDVHVSNGKAGKIYIIVKGPSRSEVAVQLYEGRFYGNNKNIEPSDIEEAFDLNGKLIEGKTPSIAEFILRGLTQSINAEVFGNNVDRSIITDLIKIIIHADEKTRVSNRVARSKQWLGRKQLWYDADKKVLYIAMPSKNSSTPLRYKITYDQLFGQTGSEELRKNVIATIARNFHWNTEKDDLSNDMVSQFNTLFKYLKQKFQSSDSYSILGIKELTFNKSDFFDERGRKKSVSQIAWLISTGRLMTDVGDTVFRDPFVFCNGVQDATIADDVLYNSILEERNKQIKQLKKQIKKEVQKKEQQQPKLKQRTKESILKEREERNEQVSNIINSKSPYAKRIQKIIDVYSKFTTSVDLLTQEDYSVLGRVIAYFQGSPKRFIAYENYEKDGIVIRGLKAFGLSNPSDRAKQYFKKNGIGTERLAEDIISFINSNVMQGQEEQYVDYTQVIDAIIQVFDNLKEFPIEFEAFLNKVQNLEEELQRSEDDEIDDIERQESAQPIIDIEPSIENQIDKVLDGIEQKYGKEIRDTIQNQLGSAQSLIESKGYKNVFLINIKFSDPNKSDKQLQDELSKYLERIPETKGMTYNSLQIKRLVDGNDLLILLENKDGSKRIVQVSASKISNIIRSAGGINGVYSSNRGILNKLDIKQSRQFLQDILGLSPSQIIVTDGILKTASDKKVFGVVMLATNIIDQQLDVPVIIMSTKGRNGMQYHEGFHYVNLLLHDENTRKDLYNEYRKRNKLFSKLSDKRIEEILAEKFRKYAKRQKDNTITSKIKKFFQNILDFVFQSRKHTLMRKIFEDILNGKYSGMKVDQKSLEEFKKSYDAGIYMDVGIPGQRSEVMNKFRHITDYKTYYQIAESLAKSYIAFVLQSTVESTIANSKNSFSRFLQILEEQTIFDDNTKYILDILNNAEGFRTIVTDVLKKYGFIGRIVKLSDDQQTEYDQMFDIDHFEMSAKDNVAYRAKLFLSCIPQGVLRNGVFETITDEYTHLEKYYNYDEAYANAVQELSRFGSYTKMYERVKQLSTKTAFFASLLKALDSIKDDIELQSQIQSALRKQSPNIMYTSIGNELGAKYKKTKNVDVDEGSMSSEEIPTKKEERLVLNQQREIKIVDDNTLRSTRATLRSWSSNLFASGMFKYNQNTETNSINADYVRQIRSQYSIICSKINTAKSQITRLTKEQLQDKINDIKSSIVALLNNIGITYDDTTFDVFLLYDLTVGDYNNNIKILNKLEQFVGTKAKQKDIKAGGLKFFIQLFEKNLIDITTQKAPSAYSHKIFKEPVSFLKTYDGYGINTDIYQLAKIYALVNPNPKEFSVRTPGGKMRYPTNENNTVSDIVRWLHDDENGYIESMLDTPYAKRSLLLNIAYDILSDFKIKDDLQFKLGLFSGMEDSQTKENGDYFQITPLDDIVNKMLFLHQNMIVFPTMADKKTFYVLRLISLSGNKESSDNRFHLPHDVLTVKNGSQDGFIKARRFSNETLNIFVNYFLDELDTLDKYYDRKNIADLIRRPDKLKINYHGKVKDGRLQFGGNGGIFRYFYGLKHYKDKNGNTINLNQMLQAAFEMQKQIEDPNSDEQVSWLREFDENREQLDLDGFELVRKELKNIRNFYFSPDGEANDVLYDHINNLLFNKIEEATGVNLDTGVVHKGELNSGDTELLRRNTYLMNRCIPNQILNEYRQLIKSKNIQYTSEEEIEKREIIRKKAIDDIRNSNIPESEKLQKIQDLENMQQQARQTEQNYVNEADVVLSAIGNYIVGQMISIIELEKIIFGDPAFYKYKYLKKSDIEQSVQSILGFTSEDLQNEENSQKLQSEVEKITTYTMISPTSGQEIVVNVDIIDEKHTDKIKRLGGVLSPGSEIRTDYTKDFLAKYPELASSKYTIANVVDIFAKSLYYDECVLRFKKQRLVDYIKEHRLDPEVAKATHTSISIETIEEPIFYFQTKKVSRTDAKQNKSVLYLFEDNLERTSNKIGGVVGKGWYSTKYASREKTLYYGINDSSRLRGIQNAFPISTRLNGNNEQITSENLEQFKKHVENEINTIRMAWMTGAYNSVQFVLNEYNLINSIENQEAREFLQDQINQLKYDLGTKSNKVSENKDIDRAVNAIYNNNDYFHSVMDSIEESVRKNIEYQAQKSAEAYEDIRVTDAQVLIRPACYRKIRIGLGQWSVKSSDLKYIGSDGLEHIVQYSDEIAYNIIENEDDWMSNEEKSVIVRHFEAYPLKMSYFSNSPQKIGDNNVLAIPVYNKMAIFPVFKFMFTSNTGKQLYQRMNMKYNEIDMIASENAVKVGIGQNIYSPFKRKAETLNSLDEAINKKSTTYINSNDGSVCENTSNEDLLPVEVQDFSSLRMQLNTESHEDVKRNIGTQMFKILFSNLDSNEEYEFSDGTRLSGRQIRENIMSYINKLTAYGVRDVKRNFYTADGNSVDEDKVARYVLRIFQNNGVGKTTEEIIARGGKASSTTPRRLLEQSVASMINRAVVDIPTNGGSAIQQSIFGLTSYSRDKILTQPEYEGKFPVPNNGKELGWIHESGAMEVMLSLNFFRHVVPKQYQHTDEDMRQWLINHDIIAGFKKDIIIRNDIGAFLLDQLDTDVVEYGVYNIKRKDDQTKSRRVLRIWLKGEKEKGYFEVTANTDFNSTKFNGDYSVRFETNNGKFGSDDVQPTTKEERQVLFDQLAKVIPYGARVSAFGNINTAGIQAIDKLGQQNKWMKSQSTRKAVSEETDEKVDVPIYVKPNKKSSEYEYYSDIDRVIINNLNQEISILQLNPVLSSRLKAAGFYTLGDIVKLKNKNQFKAKLKAANIQISDQDIDMIERHLNEFSIPFGTMLPTPKYVQSNPKPFGVGYRIPTQGISSTFAFIIADVLPRNVGDLIIVPREFTGQTGSDFDVDKIYLATLSYSRGILEEGESLGGIRNKLLQTYIEILINTKNFSNARGSIDTITNKIKNEILPKIKKKSIEYKRAMYELTPYFQENTKKEFSTGKDGIPPFALNITNLALTQFANLTFTYPEDNNTTGFRLKDLDRSLGEDGLPIADWLSAMINAHVDVAKDPYISLLNVNSATYNMANFLFRAGKGASTLLFLAQPALKQFAQEMTSRGGIYSGNVDPVVKTEYENQILDRILQQYRKAVNEEYEKLYGTTPTASNKDINKKDAIVFYINQMRDGDINWYAVFDEKFLSDGLSSDNKLKQLVVQELVVSSFIKLKKYADELGELIQCSQIDTKKFGNDTPTHLNFVNTLGNFTRKTTGVGFTLTIEYEGIPAYASDTTTALAHYFQDSYLSNKLFTALQLYDEILSTQLITATSMYKKAFIDVMSNIVGDSSVEGCYKRQKNKDKVRAIGEALDNIIRTQTLFEFSKDVEESSDYYGPIDFTFGKDKDELFRQFDRIMNGDPLSQDPYERLSLFSNISKLIQDINNDPRNELYAGMTDKNGVVNNELLQFLRPMPASDKNKIPKMSFTKSKIGITDTEKAKITSAFEFMLTHKNKRIRRVARDIAVYAYYSTYDMNVGGSFFDLVPYEFRHQYDDAIKEGLKAYRSYYMIDTEDITDMVCRNFWYDNQIVPVYKVHPKDKFIELFGPNAIGTTISQYIFTEYSDAAYIKMYNSKKGKYYLYKHAYDVNVLNKTGKIQRVIPVYVLTSRYGLHDGNNHVYEFLNNSEKSVYDENKIPNVKLDGMQLFANSILHKKKFETGSKIQIVKHLFSDKQAVKYGSKYTNQDLDTGSYTSVNIKISDQSPSQFSQVNVDLYMDREYLIETLSTTVEFEQRNGDGSISFTGEPNVQPTSAYINDYIQEQLFKYESRISSDVKFSDRQKKIQQFKEKLDGVSKQNARLRFIREYLHEVFLDLQLNGLVPDTIYIEINSETGKELLKMLLFDAKVDPEKITIISSENITNSDILNIISDQQNVLSDDEIKDFDQSQIQAEDIVDSVSKQEETQNPSKENDGKKQDKKEKVPGNVNNEDELYKDDKRDARMYIDPNEKVNQDDLLKETLTKFKNSNNNKKC